MNEGSQVVCGLDQTSMSTQFQGNLVPLALWHFLKVCVFLLYYLELFSLSSSVRSITYRHDCHAFVAIRFILILSQKNTGNFG
jgi:hypothetical protein